MANILTPTQIWSDFKVAFIPTAEVVSERKKGEAVFQRIKIEGRKTRDGQVKIAAVLVRGVQLGVTPAVILAQDFNKPLQDELAISLVKQGYTVLIVDLAGKRTADDREAAENDFYTQYPDSIAYSNYIQAAQKLYTFEGSVTKSCWYEWCAAVRYAIAYLDSLPYVTSIGAVGIGEGATVIWHTAATDDNLSCAAFLLNAGWRVYNGLNKFGEQVVPEFTDSVMRVLAGVEPQSYAPHVKCPTYTVVSLNDALYDSDRADDTVSRTGETVYSAFDYSVGTLGYVGAENLKSISLFLKEFLLKANRVAVGMPLEVEAKCDVKDGAIEIEVTPDKTNLEKVVLYAAEGEERSHLRAWVRVADGKQKDGVYTFRYQPYQKSGLATFFARATYKGGFTVSSNTISKRFNEEEIAPTHKAAVLYSSRFDLGESIFVSAADKENLEQSSICFNQKNAVVEKSGPMGIYGAYCSGGLSSFCVNAERYKPTDSSMLMFDVAVRKETTLAVKLIADFFGERLEYVARVSLKGGNIWHNVKLEMPNFKLENGMGLKSYEKIQAIQFVADNDFILNNVLWV